MIVIIIIIIIIIIVIIIIIIIVSSFSFICFILGPLGWYLMLNVFFKTQKFLLVVVVVVPLLLLLLLLVVVVVVLLVVVVPLLLLLSLLSCAIRENDSHMLRCLAIHKAQSNDSDQTAHFAQSDVSQCLPNMRSYRKCYAQIVTINLSISPPSEKGGKYFHARVSLPCRHIYFKMSSVEIFTLYVKFYYLTI